MVSALWLDSVVGKYSANYTIMLPCNIATNA